jgi:hypothetical protein
VTKSGRNHIAQNSIRWVSAVKRPLTLSELREALTVKTGQISFPHDHLINGVERLEAWCGNLITLDEESQEVWFAHHSIKQFLFEGALPALSAPESFYFSLSAADDKVGEAFVTYLNYSDFEQRLAIIPEPSP